jgi:hypothetical protein
MSDGALLFSKSRFDVFYVFYKAEGTIIINELEIYKHLDNLTIYRTDEF